MRLTNVKAMIAKAMMFGLAAGAFALAGTQKADAQVAFGVRIGCPPPPPVVAYGPAYYGPRPYGPYAVRRAEIARHDAFVRREMWAHRYYRY
jgi:hypothetical protein